MRPLTHVVSKRLRQRELCPDSKFGRRTLTPAVIKAAEMRVLPFGPLVSIYAFARGSGKKKKICEIEVSAPGIVVLSKPGQPLAAPQPCEVDLGTGSVLMGCHPK